jgi:hypothetical protein
MILSIGPIGVSFAPLGSFRRGSFCSPNWSDAIWLQSVPALAIPEEPKRRAFRVFGGPDKPVVAKLGLARALARSGFLANVFGPLRP